MNQTRDVLLINMEGGANKNTKITPVFSHLNFDAPRWEDRVYKCTCNDESPIRSNVFPRKLPSS